MILVAIRNLPYDWIVTMKGEGLLPFFEGATESAYFTRLEPFRTSSPKSLWASLATGKLPYRHRVTGRFSYRTPLNRDEPFLLLPYGVGFRAWGLIPPVERISAALPAGEALPVWTLFERLQLPSRVVAWPSLPSPKLPRFPVTAVAARFNNTGAARPQILAALERDLAAIQETGSDAAFTAVAVEGFSVAQRALHIYRNELPERGSVKGDALRAYAQQLDRALDELARANSDHLLVVCAPSGVVPPELPANIFALARNELAASEPGSDDGFVLLSGADVAHRENPTPVHVTDVVPTLLFAAGLPVGRDMDGRVVTDAFSDQMLRSASLSAIQTYEAERVVVRRTGS